LQEVLDDLDERLDLTNSMNREAFNTADIEIVQDVQVSQPKLLSVKASTVLQLLLVQIRGTYLIHSEYIEVRPIESLRPEFWKQWTHLAPTVNAEFTGQSLDVALRQLSDTSGINVVLDVRAGDKAKISVTAMLHGVPIDTAVMILADMADLKSMVFDNVLYVTTKENAEQLKTANEIDKRPP